ncbi:hypothetical protein DAERI_010349 [Deinococcus aerius]|uniref:Peptidase S8/S53 domain-containing protein n=2 Tax=Deinococcus aerius TaxID=200253 RepID=A0A2I9DPV8_9DEIO|nr:hypothetical protein DAERI_010349 [Deinococcus aerius]
MFRDGYVRLFYAPQTEGLAWKVGSQREACEKPPGTSFSPVYRCKVPSEAALGEQDVFLIDGGQQSGVVDTVTVLPEVPEYTAKVQPGLGTKSFPTRDIQFLKPSSAPGVRNPDVDRINRIIRSSGRASPSFDLRARQLADGRVVVTPAEADLMGRIAGVRGSVLPAITGLPPRRIAPLAGWKQPLNEAVTLTPRPTLLRGVPMGAILPDTLRQNQRELLKGVNGEAIRRALSSLRGGVNSRVYAPNGRVEAYFRGLGVSGDGMDLCATSYSLPILSADEARVLGAIYAEPDNLPADIAPTKELGTETTAPPNPAAQRKSEQAGHEENVGTLEAVRPSPRPGKYRPIIYVIDTMTEDEAGRQRDDYVSRDGAGTPHYGHGRHIAAIIKQLFEAPPEDLVSLAACDSSGRCATPKVIHAICQAIMARRTTGRPVLVNLSLSTPVPGKYLRQVIDLAVREGVMFVAAHGSGTPLRPGSYECRELQDEDQCHYFPADWSAVAGPLGQHVISVAALERADGSSQWSDYPYGRVVLAGGRNIPPDVRAPGVFYFPSPETPNSAGERFRFPGTSFAAPVVTGLLAQLMSTGTRQKPSEWTGGLDLTKGP